MYGIRKKSELKLMFRNKKAQVGDKIGQFSTAIVISIFVFGAFYGFTPLMIEYRNLNLARDINILLRIIMYSLVPFMWTIWLFGSAFLFKKAIDGEAILGE